MRDCSQIKLDKIYYQTRQIDELEFHLDLEISTTTLV